jgi:hypothetical protein
VHECRYGGGSAACNLKIVTLACAGSGKPAEVSALVNSSLDHLRRIRFRLPDADDVKGVLGGGAAMAELAARHRPPLLMIKASARSVCLGHLRYVAVEPRNQYDDLPFPSRVEGTLARQAAAAR